MKNTVTNNMSNNPIEELRELTTPVSEQEWASITSDKRYTQKFGRKHGLTPRGRAAIIAGTVAVLVTVPVLVKTLAHREQETAQAQVPATENVQSASGAVASPAVVSAPGSSPATVSAAKPDRETATPAAVTVVDQAAEHERSTMDNVIAKRQQTTDNQEIESQSPLTFPDPASSTNARLTVQDIKTTPLRIESDGIRPIQRNRTEQPVSSVTKENPSNPETSVMVDSEESEKQDLVVTSEPEADADQFFIPSAFTPNDDGLNDIFYVRANFEPRNYELAVFNRNGDLVFITRDLNAGWDGKQHGALMRQGMYVYLIKYTDREGKEKRKQGQILLVN